MNEQLIAELQRRSAHLNRALECYEQAQREIEAAAGVKRRGRPPKLGNGSSSVASAAAQLGRLGGAIGGKRRAEMLSPRRRKAIAKAAAEARWGNGGAKRGQPRKEQP